MPTRRARRREFTDLRGRRNVLFTPPDAWTEAAAGPLLPEMADALVQQLREAGVQLWLHANPDGTVRTRMALPFEPPPEVVRILSEFARDLGKAVARTGDFNPPPDNPWGDRPLPPGGHWDWGD